MMIRPCDLRRGSRAGFIFVDLVSDAFSREWKTYEGQNTEEVHVEGGSPLLWGAFRYAFGAECAMVQDQTV